MRKATKTKIFKLNLKQQQDTAGSTICQQVSGSKFELWQVSI
jgi:hypothetical protein